MMGGLGLAVIFLSLCFGCSVVCQSTCFNSVPEIQLHATSTKQFITSPGFPNNYTNNLLCFWTISDTDGCSLIRIDVLSLNVEQGIDKVKLKSGSSNIYLYEKGSVFVIASDEILVTFYTDGSIVGKGFNMSFAEEDCVCVNTSGIDVVATSTPQYITSPGFPYHYPHDIQCKWSISSSATCSLLRMEVIFVGIADSSDNLTFTFDDRHLTLKSNLVYYIPSEHSFLGFQSDSSLSGKGFNVSYQAVDLRVTSSSPVFDCEESQLLAQEQPKYIYSSNNYSMVTTCEWMIFVAEPCMTSRKGTSSMLTMVVEELRTNGSATVKIAHAPSLEHKKIDISKDSNLLGRPLYFHVPVDEFIVITFLSSEGSEMKISYRISPKDVLTETNQQTVWIAATAVAGGVFVISLIVHLIVCILRRRQVSHTHPVNSIEMTGTQQEITNRPYVRMNQVDHDRGRQGETSTDEVYELVNDEPVASNKIKESYNMDMRGSKNTQGDEIYENEDVLGRDTTKSSSFCQDNAESDGEVYEEIEDYMNASICNKRH